MTATSPRATVPPSVVPAINNGVITDGTVVIPGVAGNTGGTYGTGGTYLNYQSISHRFSAAAPPCPA